MTEEVHGICWPQGGTVGHLTVTTPLIHGTFPQAHGDDGLAQCELTPAGKYRNGAARSWCRTHQQYWGTRADLDAQARDAIQRCARHAERVHYVCNPLALDPRAHERIDITLAGTALLVETDTAPGIVVPALAIAYDFASELFPATGIVQINVTPPAVLALQTADGCLCCARCGHPHLDLGDFAHRAHKRHYCGHCGTDSTHSKQPMVSNPLHALMQHYGARLRIAVSIVH